MCSTARHVSRGKCFHSRHGDTEEKRVGAGPASARRWPVAIAALEAPGLQAEAAAALVAGGKTVLPALQAAFARPDLP